MVGAALAARPYDDIDAALLDEHLRAFAGCQRESIEVLFANRHMTLDRRARVDRGGILLSRFRGGWRRRDQESGDGDERAREARGTVHGWTIRTV